MSSSAAIPQGLACLTITHAGSSKAFHAFISRISISYIVIRKLLTLKLRGVGNSAISCHRQAHYRRQLFDEGFPRNARPPSADTLKIFFLENLLHGQKTE